MALRTRVENHWSTWQSHLSWRGCHSRELQDQPFTFCRWFGTASILTTVFSMYLIGFLLRETKSEWKWVLKIPRFYSMSLYKPKAMYVVSEQHYTAAGGDVQLRRGGIYVWRTVEPQEIDTRIGKANAILRELYRSVLTKRELSNTAKLSVSNQSLFRSLPMVMNLG